MKVTFDTLEHKGIYGTYLAGLGGIAITPEGEEEIFFLTIQEGHEAFELWADGTLDTWTKSEIDSHFTHNA